MANVLIDYIRDWWGGPDSTGDRFVKSSAVVFLEKFIIKIFQFVRTIVVARLLFPHDIGLFGLAALSMTITETFIQTGFNAALVQDRGKTEEYLNSAWTVNVIRGFVMAAILFFVAAPVAGKFFKDDNIIMLARALSLVFIIDGFDNIAIVFFQKNLRFIRMTVLNISCFAIQAVVTIIAAYTMRSPWALLVGLIANRVTFLAFSYIMHPYRPKFTLNFEGAKHLFKYGRWIALTGIVSFMIGQGDNITIGRLLNPTLLAYYYIAFSIGMMPAAELVRSFTSVLFPLYAIVQDDRERLRRNFIRVSRVIFALAIPACAGILVLAPDIIKAVYGPRWLGVVAPLYVTVFLGLLRTFEYMVTPVFLGIGKPRVQLYGLVIQFGVMFSLIVPLTQKFQLVGTALAVLAGAFVVEIIYFFLLRREVRIGFRAFFDILAWPIIGSLIMTLVIIGSIKIVGITGMALLLVYVVFGATVYFLTFLGLDKWLCNGRFYESIIWIKNSVSPGNGEA